VISEHIRLAGLFFAGLLAVYAVVRYRYYGGWRRFDLLLALLVALGVGVVSVFPQVGEVFVGLLGLEQRAFALLSASTLLLFALFLYLLGQLRENNRRNGALVSSLAVRQYAERYLEDGPEDGAGKVLIIVPAYNEEGSIRQVLFEIPDELLGYRVKTVVVVDGATDATERIALECGFPVAPHLINRGQGDALRTGFEIARLENADIAINLDADGQYRADEMEKLIKPIMAGEADYVHGSRFMGYYEEAGSVRHAGVVFFSYLISLLTGIKITDCTNGFRAIRGSELHKLDLREDRFNATELILEAARNGLRIREVPVSMLRRAHGETKKPPRLRYPLGVFRVIIETWLR
jgi:hypothetical protein